MTNQQHPITPPPELVDQWTDKYQGHMPEWVLRHVAADAAQWGSDQELEACCEWFILNNCDHIAKKLIAARRPKPPSLKEQALEVVTGLEKRWDLQCDLALLRRALETLPND